MKWRRRRFQKRRAQARKLGFKVGSDSWRAHLGLPSLAEMRAQRLLSEGLPTTLNGNRKTTQVDMRAYIDAPIQPKPKKPASPAQKKK